MKNRQQLLMSVALSALQAPKLTPAVSIEDAKTMCHQAGAWLAQSGLSAAMDAVARYQHAQVSAWLKTAYIDALNELGRPPQGDLREWAIRLDSVENLRVTRDLMEFNHTLTRVVRLKKEGLL